MKPLINYFIKVPEARTVKEMMNPKWNVHHLWWKYCKKFKKEDKKSSVQTYKYSGHELMEKIRKWAKKYPDVVRCYSCDDAVHAGSLLVVFEHSAPKRRDYMGITVIFISQCTGEQPIEFFLYPGALKTFIKGLQYFKRRSWDKF